MLLLKALVNLVNRRIDILIVKFWALDITSRDMPSVELGEVDAILEQRISNGLQVHVMAVRGKLHAIRQAPRNILQESGSKPRVSISDHPTDNELRIGIQRGEGPGITANARSGHFRRDVLLLRPNKAPYFVDLNSPSRDNCEE
jgi:hypothetical protein